MLNWKSAAVAALALGSAMAAAHVVGHRAHAQEAHETGAQDVTHEQIAALLALLIADMDADALVDHVDAVLRAHADEIGGDTEAIAAHVSEFVGRASAEMHADPEGAARHIMEMISAAHAPRDE